MLNRNYLENPEKSWAHNTFYKSRRESINDWNEVKECREISKNIDVNCVVSTIRKALAHGSIYTLNEKENQINEIIFMSEFEKCQDKYRFVKVSSNDFKIFLEKWFAFLQSVKDNTSLVIQELEEFAEKDN